MPTTKPKLLKDAMALASTMTLDNSDVDLSESEVSEGDDSDVEGGLPPIVSAPVTVKTKTGKATKKSVAGTSAPILETKLGATDRKAIQVAMRTALAEFSSGYDGLMSTLKAKSDDIITTVGKATVEKRPVKKPVVKMTPINLSTVYKVYKTSFLPHVQKKTITQKELLGALYTNAFQDNYLIRSSDNYAALNLTRVEATIIARRPSDIDPLNITKADAKILQAKLVTVPTTFEYMDHVYDVTNDDLWSEMKKNDCFLRNVGDGTLDNLIPTDLNEILRVTFGKKATTNSKKINYTQFTEYIASVTRRSTNLFYQVSHDRVDLLDTFNVPYAILEETHLYTKQALLKAAFLEQLNAETKTFSGVYAESFKSNFPDLPVDKIKVDDLVTRCAYKKEI